MKRYNPKELEPKWQKVWEDSKIYQAASSPASEKAKPKKYVLEYFPYPSGAAMHVGHVRNYTIGDAIARYNRMRGYNVLHPMGWDAFGLPAENYAIKTGITPQEAVAKNVAQFKKQLMQMGFSYDWSREINSTDPKYYKWTQWFFLLLFKKGLAYQQESLQWWCPNDKTVLANEQVENGKCWRCGNEVEKKSLNQWFFKITDYADRLEKDLDDVNWSQSIKTMQRNWIGKSKGAEVDFVVDNQIVDTDFVFLHAYKGSSTSDFWPWLKKEVTSVGGRVYSPDLPNSDKPSVDEQVEFLLKNHDFSKHTHLITHSLGGVVAMKLLPKLEGKIKKLTMIAPPLKTEFLDGKKRPILDEATDWTFDFEAVKNKVEQIVVVADIGDSIVPITHPEEIAKQLEAEYVKVVASVPHFNNKVEPELLPLVLPHIKVFTTRPDTLYGATFMVLAPENPLVSKLTVESEKSKVEKYVKDAQAKSDIERQETEREKTGVFTGAYATNPVNEEQVPIWIADYVLMGYGTGAIMAVPAHDERDWEFAKKFGLEIVEVIEKPKGFKGCYTGEGKLMKSDKYDGMASSDAREIIVSELAEKKLAEEKVNYKMRDWLISRQRYWGTPIPIIHCSKCGVVPVPEDQLPVELPEIKSYEPSGDGRSPLANVPEFVDTTCPKCGGKAERETDTMDGFACSSWYFLRFADPHNSKKPFDRELVERWLPVDDYIGGAEHAVMHLLYARFWTKVMYDEGLISFEEPFTTLRNHGMILAPDGQKMSKSKNNTIEPDELISQGYGADAIRLMELFIGPWDQSVNWSIEGVGGVFRFLQRVWTLTQEFLSQQVESEKPAYRPGRSKVKSSDEISEKLLRLTHKTINKVSKDLEELSFNTAIAALMEDVNELYKIKAKYGFSKDQPWKDTISVLLQLLAPFAPHISEELWHQLGNTETIHIDNWPVHDEKYLVSDTMTIVVQVNGKLRANLEMPTGSDEGAITEAAKADTKVKTYLDNKKIRKTIYVPDKLVNFVV